MKNLTLNFKEKKMQKLLPLINKNYNGLRRKLDSIKRGRINADAVNALFFLSRHKDVYVRQSVMEIIKDKIQKNSRAEREKLFPLLLVGIGDKDCRYAALEGLIHYPEVNLIDLLGSILLQDKNPLVRVQISDILVNSNQSSAVPYLKYSLNDKDALVRVYSAYGLALLGSKNSIPNLIELQKKDRKASVKAACWGGLLLLTREHVWLEKILKVLKHHDYHVPMQAINYLSNAVDEKVISKEDVVPHVLDCFREEKREAVSSRMKRFLEEAKKKGRKSK